jgi:hypothetical protein
MRFVRSAAITLTLATAAILSATAVPALAADPVIDVTPPVAEPGTSVTFTVTCGTPATSATSATLFGATLGLSEQIPMKASTHAGEFVTTVELPASISPGSYSPSIDCSNGVSGGATLNVNPAPPGTPLTGGGTTSSSTGGPFRAAGRWLLAVGGLAVAAAVIRIRRRRTGARS